MPILLEDGAKIKAFDPVGKKVYERISYKQITYCNSIEETLDKANICFIFTDWDCIKNMDIQLFERLMKTPIILDGRNCFDIEKIKQYKVIYESIGREIINNV